MITREYSRSGSLAGWPLAPLVFRARDHGLISRRRIDSLLGSAAVTSHSDIPNLGPSDLVPLPSPVVSAPSSLFRTTSGDHQAEVSIFLAPDDFNVAWSLALSPMETATLHALHLLSNPPTLERLRSGLGLAQAPSADEFSEVVTRLIRIGILLPTPQASRALGSADAEESMARLRSFLNGQVRSRTSAALREKLSRWTNERPFYGEKLAGVDLQELSIETLADIPTLGKDEARINLPGILAPALADYEVEWRGSSGTTDERFQAAHESSSLNPWSREAKSINRHYRVYPSSVLTTPVCSGTECHAEMELPFERRRSPPGDRGFLYFFFNSGMNPTAFSAAKLRAIYDELLLYRPSRLTANAAYLAAFVYWARREGLAPPPLDVVWAGFEVPSEIHKSAIKDYFGCRLYEAYGLTEAGGELAIECEAGGNLHFVPWQYCFEVLDEAGRPAADGKEGTVHLTTLAKEFTPLVRYNTGDHAFAVSACSCGCPLPAMSLVQGRSKDVIRSTKGNTIFPRQLDLHLAKTADGIGWYQLQQTGEVDYHLWVTPEGRFGDHEQRAARDNLMDLLGSEARLSITPTKSISPSLSGKFRLCYRTEA